MGFRARPFLHQNTMVSRAKVVGVVLTIAVMLASATFGVSAEEEEHRLSERSSDAEVDIDGAPEPDSEMIDEDDTPFTDQDSQMRVRRQSLKKKPSNKLGKNPKLTKKKKAPAKKGSPTNQAKRIQ